MARYIREVRDYNGALLSREESSQPFPRTTECGDWYQPGHGKLVVRHVRQLSSRDEAGPAIHTIVTVGPPFVVPQAPRLGFRSHGSRAS
jgi:hypothetical protein